MQKESKVLVDDGCGCCDSLTAKEATTSSSGSSDAMNIRNAGAEGDSGCRDPLTPEGKTASSSGSTVATCARNTVRHIKDKKCTIAAIVIIVFIIVIIALAVRGKKTESCPFRPSLANKSASCPDFWVGYRGKCFYTSKEERNWTLSLKACSSLNASLAVIDSQNELEFWVRIFRPFHYWIGLSREINQAWKWFNGTEFKTQFPVRGEGFCAYLNEKGADSTLCSMEKHFFCSRPEKCSKAG